MSTATQLMTADDLWNLPEDHMRHELVKGELRTMAPAGFDHGAVGINLATGLAHFVKKHQLGTVVGPDTGFIISRDPDTVRAPDCAFVRRDRVPTPRPLKFWPGAPDLAVEVLSPSDTAFEVDEKVQEMLDAGTEEVIVVNPRQKTVKIFRKGQTALVLGVADTLENLSVLPGFRCPVAEIFE
jgi:Uma2 family endonuclease